MYNIYNCCCYVSLSRFRFVNRFIFVSFSDGSRVGGVSRFRPHGASPDSRLEFDICLQLAEQRPQDVHELTPELHTHKGVQDGIEAAVEASQSEGHCYSLI